MRVAKTAVTYDMPATIRAAAAFRAATLRRALLLVILVAVAGCASGARTTPATPTPAATFTPSAPPQKYIARVVLRGAQPDDLAFDRQGRLLFSDLSNGSVRRLNADGSTTIVASGLAGPEGMVVLADGTLVVAEQYTNRILTLAPGASTPTVLRALPGRDTNVNCKHGVDGIGFDATTQTLIVPDSPTGAVYRLSIDGKMLTQLSTGIARPVGAAADATGTIYVADECGAAVWRIPPGGSPVRIGGFGMPDDVALDPQGDLLVIDLDGKVHALIRIDRASGQRETLAQQGLIEPQGLVVDAQGDIYVADELAHEIVEYVPAG
jgi:sugar lactone lactonase YvrE